MYKQIAGTLDAFFNNIWISFTNKKALKDGIFVGLENYAKVMQDNNFWQSLGNTVWYVVICVPCVIVISTILAVMLNSQIRGKGIFRTLIFFSPGNSSFRYCYDLAVAAQYPGTEWV